jgi:hypothetical protein
VTILDDPLNEAIAGEMRAQPHVFQKKALEWTQRFATGRSSDAKDASKRKLLNETTSGKDDIDGGHRKLARN